MLELSLEAVRFGQAGVGWKIYVVGRDEQRHSRPKATEGHEVTGTYFLSR